MTVIPRPASTVVLLDQESKVYLTQRPKTMKFMGGFYVFPGGAVDRADEVNDPEHLSGERNESVDLAYYVAAARELYEEVGILLCQTNEGTIDLLNEEQEMEYRRLLLNREISFLHMLKRENLHLPFENLAYIGQIITPKMSPIRFDTRFFLAHLPTGQSPKPDANEISHSCWLSPEDALSANQAGKISLAPPTIHTLKTILDYLEGHPLSMPEFKMSDYKMFF